jgi:putative transposase
MIMDLTGRIGSFVFPIQDRDAKFTSMCDDVFASEGARMVKTPLQAPRANAYAERWAGTARAEVTDRMLIGGSRHLRAVVDEYAAHHDGHRPHRARNLRPPVADESTPAVVSGLGTPKIRRRGVLGGLINDYERAA